VKFEREEFGSFAGVLQRELDACEKTGIPFAVFGKRISEAQMIEVLNDLRERFRIPINVVPGGGMTIDEPGCSIPIGNNPIFINVSVDALIQMAADPDWHRSVTEKIQHLLDESPKLFNRAGSSLSQVIMGIGSSTINYGYAIGPHISDSELSRIRDVLDEFVQALTEWAANHKYGTDEEDVDRFYSSINYWATNQFQQG
jgi:hypothetical protein